MIRRRSASILLALAALVGPPSALHADNIDDALLTHAPQVISQLQLRGLQKIGVLTFRYQHGDGPPQFRGSPICTNMAQRVESALVLKLSSNQPELVLLPRAAAVAAGALPGASYSAAEERRRLFDIQYPQAWGSDDRLSPDAFIVGSIKVAKDLRSAVVSLRAFDRDSMFDVLDFEVQTDRFLLADIGHGFSSTKAGLRAIGGAGGFPIELTVHYDNAPQVMGLDGNIASSNGFSLPEPQAGQSLTFDLKNRTQGPLGVVLMVNGVSTLYEQEGQPDTLNKWVVEPDKLYRVKGYHQSDNAKYRAITTLSEVQSKEQFEALGGERSAGLIQLFVFTPAGGDAVGAPLAPGQFAAGDTGSFVSTIPGIVAFTRSIGRLPRSSEYGRKYATLVALKQAIARKSNLFPPGTRPLAGWGRELNETLQEKNLGPTLLTDAMIVRYSRFRP